MSYLQTNWHWSAFH